MNKNLIGFALAFVFLATLAVPVMAVSPKSVPAVLYIDTTKVQNTAPEYVKITEGSIVQQRGIIRTVEYNPSTPGATLTIGGVPYVVEIHAVVDVTINTKTTQMINHYHKWTIRLPSQEGLSEDGEFVGTNFWALSTDPSVSFVGHGVLQGSGAFEGQTLKLSAEFPPSFNFIGYLMP